MREITWVNIALLLAVGVFGAVLIGRNAEHYEIVIEAKDREIAELQDHIREQAHLNRYTQSPKAVFCVDVDDMTAREFLWHLEGLCDKHKINIQ